MRYVMALVSVFSSAILAYHFYFPSFEYYSINSGNALSWNAFLKNWLTWVICLLVGWITLSVFSRQNKNKSDWEKYNPEPVSPLDVIDPQPLKKIPREKTDTEKKETEKLSDESDIGERFSKLKNKRKRKNEKN